MAGGEFSDEMRHHVWYECPNWIFAKNSRVSGFLLFASSDVLPLISKGWLANNFCHA